LALSAGKHARGLVVDADGGEMDHAAHAARLARRVERGNAFDMHARGRLARAVAHRTRCIDHRVDAVECGMPVVRARRGRNIEADVARAIALSARHSHAFMAVGRKPRHQRRADESRAAENEDAHGSICSAGEAQTGRGSSRRSGELLTHHQAGGGHGDPFPR
jgi:hypothetical protein